MEGGSQSLGQVTSSMCTGNQYPSHPSRPLNMLLSAYCDDRDKPLVRIIAATKTKKSDKVRKFDHNSDIFTWY